MLLRTTIAFTAALACAGALAHESAKRPLAARGVAATPKANGSGVALRYELPARVEPGQPATLTLWLSGVETDDAAVEVRAPGGVSLRPAAAAIALPRGTETTLTFSVTPATHGVHYLDVFTRQHGRVAAHSIALSTGTVAAHQLKPSGTAQTTPSGERVVSLPAQ